jgi:UDP-glucose 4-epimerase
MAGDSPNFQPYRSRRALVTGATGFIGRQVAQALSSAGADLWLTARDERRVAAVSEVHQIRGQWVITDLAQSGAFVALFREIQPEIVFHLAAYGVDPSERDEQLAVAINNRLVGEIAEAAALRAISDWPGLSLVHAGTTAEYGHVAGPLSECSTEAPVNPYGRSKLAGTRALTAALRRTGLRAVTARLFTVYGPGEHPSRLLPLLLEAAHSGGNLPLTGGEQKRDFTYVADVTEGLLRLGALASAAPEVVNLATGKLTSVRKFVESAAELLGLRASQLQFGKLPYAPDELQQGPADNRLLRESLDWVPGCSIPAGIQQTIEAHLKGTTA